MTTDVDSLIEMVINVEKMITELGISMSMPWVPPTGKKPLLPDGWSVIQGGAKKSVRQPLSKRHVDGVTLTLVRAKAM